MSNELIVNGNFFQEGLRALGTDMSRILHRPLFTLGTIAVSPAFIFESLIFFAALTLVSGSAERVLRTRVLVRTALDVEHRYRLARLFSLTVFIIVLIVGVDTAGVDLRSLALLSSALGLGVGLGLQSIVANFRSRTDSAHGAARQVGRSN